MYLSFITTLKEIFSPRKRLVWGIFFALVSGVWAESLLAQVFPEDAHQPTNTTVRATSHSAEYCKSLPELELAKSALKDGLYDIAKDSARKVYAERENDVESRRMAFSILLDVSSRTLSEPEFARMFTAAEFEGLPWPQGDAEFALICDYWHAKACLQIFDYEKAERLLTSVCAVMHSDNPLRISGVRLLAYVHEVNGTPETALSLLSQEGESLPEIVFDRAQLLIQHNRALEAVELLDSFVAETNRLDVAAIATLLQAQALNDAGMQTNALKKLVGMASNPDDFPADYRALVMASAAQLYVQEGSFSNAVELAERAVEIAEAQPIQLKCKIGLANVLAEMGAVERAIPCVRKLVLEAPRSILVANLVKHVGDVFYNNMKYESALEMYDLFIESFSASSQEQEIQYGRGLTYEQLKQPAEAAQAYLNASAIASRVEDKIVYLQAAAKAQYDAGFTRQVISTISMLLELNPEKKILAKIRLLEAECMCQIDSKQAERYYLAVAETFAGTEESSRAYFRLAELNVLTDAHDSTPEGRAKSTNWYGLAAETTNVNFRASALLGIGLVYLHSGSYAEALVNFDAVVSLPIEGEVREQAQLMRAETLLSLGRTEEAEGVVAKIVATPSDTRWYREGVFWMGRRYFNQGKSALAESTFLRYVAEWPDDEKSASALLFVAQSKFQQKQFHAAIDTSRMIIEKYEADDNVVLAQFIYAESLVESLQFDDAIVLYDAIIQCTQDELLRIVAMVRRGDCLFTLGGNNAIRYAESIAAYQAVLEFGSRIPFDVRLQCEYKIGRSLEKAKRWKEAKEHYYARVVLPFEAKHAEQSIDADSQANVWYARAILGTADIYEREAAWESAVSILKRIAVTSNPGATKAMERIERIQKSRIQPIVSTQNVLTK